jgi:hypothetical protein
MTGYTVHTGSTTKFSTGWDTIFGRTSRKQTVAAKKSVKAKTKKKTPRAATKSR